MDRDWRAQFKRVVGDRMRRCRLASKLSRAAVARALQISKNQYIGYERGVNHPSSEILMRLATVLDLPPGQFSKGMATLVAAMGFTDTEQELYKNEPAAASRSRANLAIAEISDSGTLSALAYLTEFLAQLDRQTL
jgi:transcriptional regulator with XRE-family HTH domain